MRAAKVAVAVLLAVVLGGALAPGRARAGGLTIDPTSPRAVGRAGAGLVSDDGAAAVATNPAALARRDAVRGQLGIVVVDDDARFAPAGGGPEAVERGGAWSAPSIGGQGRVGPVVVGAALVEEARLERRFPAPEPGQPVDAVERLFPHRYAGLAAATRRRTVAIAAAWRAREWLAVGAAVTVARVEIDETRRVWAGFAGRDPVGGAARDVTVRIAGEDGIVPGGAIGVLVAPVAAPVELACSAAWGDRARLDGEVTAAAARPGLPPSVTARGATAAATLATPLVVRTGARWLGERWGVEVGGELVTAVGDDPVWTIRGVTVTDDTGATAPVSRLRSQVARRPHGAVRAALDVEVAGGLWVSAGWAWASAATPRDRLAPAAAELGGHAAAVGVEVAVDGVTVTLGLARAWSGTTEVAHTRLALDNPFGAGTAPTGLGRHAHTRDVVAIAVEVELP